MGLSSYDQFVHRSLTNSPPGKIDDSFKAFFVFGVDQNPKIGQDVFNFFTLIKLKPAKHPIGNISFAQRIFHGT